MLLLPFARVLHCREVRKDGQYTSVVVKYITIDLAVGSVTPSLGKSCSAGWVCAPLQEQLQELLGMEKPRQPSLVPLWAAPEPRERLGVFRPLDGWLQIPGALKHS